MKDDLAWQPCTDLEAQQDGLSTLLRAYEAATLQSLTGYPYLVEAIYALRVYYQQGRALGVAVDQAGW